MIPRTIIVGNLTRDPETIVSSGGLSICKASIAVNEWRKDQEDYVSYYDITIFGKSGEAFGNHHKKGDKVLVEGKLRQERWESNGDKRSKVVIIVDKFEFVKSDKVSTPGGSF